MGAVHETNMVIGFMVSASVKRELDRQAKQTEMSRSEYIRCVLEWCLDEHNQKAIGDELLSRILGALGSMLQESAEPGDGKQVPVQAVLSKAYVAQIDRFAEGMKQSRVNALATLVEIGLKQTAALNPLALPLARASRRRKQTRLGHRMS
ncbi:MAG: hypothetical protein HS116_28550 [Planctomycetes bacterium]|nr:hypothetical protein [Planctomycetota bacterium]